MSETKRDLQHVDPSIRSTIVTRIIFYWGACVLFSTLPLIIGTTLANSDRMFIEHLQALFQRYWPLYVMILGIVPFAVKDALRIANRTLGPLARLKNELKRYQETGTYRPLQCRSDDFLGDLIQQVNEAITAQSHKSVDNFEHAEHACETNAV